LWMFRLSSTTCRCLPRAGPVRIAARRRFVQHLQNALLGLCHVAGWLVSKGTELSLKVGAEYSLVWRMV
jgi:hypothetical protein